MNQESTPEARNAADPSKSPVDVLMDQLVDIGSEWAVFGLHCGSTALEKSARTLRIAARTLSTLSRNIEQKSPRSAAEVQADAVVTDPRPDGTPEPTITADPSAL